MQWADPGVKPVGESRSPSPQRPARRQRTEDSHPLWALASRRTSPSTPIALHAKLSLAPTSDELERVRLELRSLQALNWELVAASSALDNARALAGREAFGAAIAPELDAIGSSAAWPTCRQNSRRARASRCRWGRVGKRRCGELQSVVYLRTLTASGALAPPPASRAEGTAP